MESRGLLLGVGAAVVVLASMSMFTVSETEKAIRFRLGEIVESDFKPGLHFKWPLINNVLKFDSRIQTLDTEPERFLTAEKKNVIVDSFVKWRVADVGRFYTAVAGDPVQANLRLDQITKDSMRSEFSKRTVQDVVAGDRGQIMDILSTTLKREAGNLGIEVIDVRIKRIDLPADVSSSVFRRMRAERERVARDFRSRGAEAAERIRADADRQSTVLLADAYRDAERVRGEGDAKAADIYAQAYNRDPAFYAFYRSLGAYRASFANKDDVLVLSPDSEFFRFFKQPK
ncbi:protease modulator HflC [Plasticicumulans acidivorans]|uniref:Protein HflC n=1 Tax=Plasticicumulans acidivorans TaxID=886464 RepID=A0A317MPY0_9GAMM|nr:protease modulator HflC [Plasticicumulans acidivorans]PWV58527.1 protease FtsH subunit HflC [Plasticicumulans acidivorans]